MFCFHRLQDYSVRVSWIREIRDPLDVMFSGDPYRSIREGMEAIHKAVLRGRVFVALHMHAGDGNVHTNIPVNSDDYPMLKEAESAVVRIMALARSLDGVVSGEHGIGLAKTPFFRLQHSPAQVRAMQAVKRALDPRGILDVIGLVAEVDDRDRVHR